MLSLLKFGPSPIILACVLLAAAADTDAHVIESLSPRSLPFVKQNFPEVSLDVLLSLAEVEFVNS